MLMKELSLWSLINSKRLIIVVATVGQHANESGLKRFNGGGEAFTLWSELNDEGELE